MRQRRIPTLAVTVAAAAMAFGTVACEVEDGEPLDDPIIDDGGGLELEEDL